MSISYEDNKGIRQFIKTDADVLQAIVYFSSQTQPGPAIMVVRLDVEPCDNGNTVNPNILWDGPECQKVFSTENVKRCCVWRALV